MTVDCQWIENNLEALMCDRLNEEESRVAREHIENCVSCRKETEALNAVDPLIKSYFSRELEIARRPRVAHRARVFGFSGATAAAVIVLLLVLTRTGQTPVLPPTPVTPPNVTAIASGQEPSKPIKADEPAEQGRAKPNPEPSAPGDRTPPAAVSSNAPDFLVSDPAGYSHALEEYRGHIVVIGVWNRDQGKAIANIERLYKAYGANPKFRFLGVANDRQPKPANTTFPILYNDGSKLFGAQPGDFVLLNETGTVELRGSLTKNYDNLAIALQRK